MEYDKKKKKSDKNETKYYRKVKININSDKNILSNEGYMVP